MKAPKYLFVAIGSILAVAASAYAGDINSSNTGVAVSSLTSDAQVQGNVGGNQSTPSTLSISLTQNDNAVVGTFSFVNGPTMQVIGEVSGNTITIQATNTSSNSQYGYSSYASNCASMVQLLTGTLTFSGKVMSGTLTGSVGFGGYSASSETCTVTINAVATN